MKLVKGSKQSGVRNLLVVEDLWHNFLDTIRNSVNPASYAAWFNDLKLLKIDNDSLTIQVPMEIHKKMLGDTYYSLIDETLFKISGINYDLKFVSKEEIEQEKKWVKGKTKIVITYSFYLVLTSISLYIVGNALSNCLENLATYFSIPEIILGIALGVITSLPELITFFESQKHHKEGEKDELGVIEATNNLLTSNVLNLFIIQAIGIFIYQMC